MFYRPFTNPNNVDEEGGREATLEVVLSGDLTVAVQTRQNAHEKEKGKDGLLKDTNTTEEIRAHAGTHTKDNAPRSSA